MLKFAIMASNFCSSKNTQQALTELNQCKKVLVEKILIPNTANVLFSAKVLVPTITIYTKNDV